MKKLLNLWAILAVTSITAFMTGCGGGGGDDDDDGGGGAVAEGFAPASMNGMSVILIHDASSLPPQEVQFSTSGNSFTAVVPATTDSLQTGTFQYNASGPDSGTLVLTGSDGSVRTINLNFTSQTAGNFSFSTGDGATGTGTFSGLTSAPQPPPGGEQPPPGGEQPPPGGEQPPPGGGGGSPPASIGGSTIHFNVSSGPLAGLMTVNFGAGGTFSSPTTEGSGNYTYTVSGNTASLLLNYTAPQEFVGDRDTINMTFTSGTSGTFNGSTRIDDAESAIGGTFQVQ